MYCNGDNTPYQQSSYPQSASVTVSTQAFMKYLDSFNETDALVRSLRVFVKCP